MRQSVQHVVGFAASASQALGPNGQRIGLWIGSSSQRFVWRFATPPISDTNGFNMSSAAQGIFLRKEDIGDIIQFPLYVWGAATGTVSILEVIDM